MQSRAEILSRMATDLAMLPSHVSSVVRTAPLRYKVFEIRKKSGGTREVAQPARELKSIQRWLVHELRALLPVHASATAYINGGSIRTNADPHRTSKHLLKLDFTDFFPSILRCDIDSHLSIHCSGSMDEEARRLVAYTLCWARLRQPPLRLCIGAPSSPLLSNSILFEFDSRLSAIALNDDVTYTRYADDITLSCARRGTLDRFEEVVRHLLSDIAYPRISLNSRKTVLVSKERRRVVTGIVLTPDGRLSIGRVRKREIRAMYHRKLLGRLSVDEIRKLQGLISFADSIEPDFSERLIRMQPPTL
jgi:RNA-directed DNA polymerase